MYKRECNLVRHFVQRLRGGACPWGTVRVSCEFQYDRGRTDILALADDGEHLIAFEAKLEKWRDALDQAYRNTCFAHSSYVVLPYRVALRAQRYPLDFEYRNVGLCYIDGDQIVAVLSPQKQAPPERWLLDEARSAVEEQTDAGKRSRTSRSQDLRKARNAVRKTGGGGNLQANLPCSESV
jgi:hypothetical protein